MRYQLQLWNEEFQWDGTTGQQGKPIQKVVSVQVGSSPTGKSGIWQSFCCLHSTLLLKKTPYHKVTGTAKGQSKDWLEKCTCPWRKWKCNLWSWDVFFGNAPGPCLLRTQTALVGADTGPWQNLRSSTGAETSCIFQKLRCLSVPQAFKSLSSFRGPCSFWDRIPWP